MNKLTKKYIFKQKLLGQEVKLKSFREGNNLELLIETGVLSRTNGEVIRVNYPIVVPMRKHSTDDWISVSMDHGALIHVSNFE